MKKRPSWDETFMAMAENIADRSACILYQVGAVFAKEKQFLQVGFNGPTRGGDNHCSEIGCAKKVNDVIMPSGSKKCRGAHAEMNGIVNAARNGVGLEGSTVYCTLSPCYDCAKHLVNLGIKRFVYKIKYEEEWPQVSKLFQEKKIKLEKFQRGGKND
ncbi:dCMP deaminase family protein [Patescibacteria group bacterium]|nr:dCMP deaminase family protein [Patescibacteria group bacterium]MBU4458328.1 dCMP deaminase family protein [Patescibacteria group bacterium]MCG2695917.1 dCMP deaminase family protein [Candidatus Portnoybacteria bacterium]